ncbi:hypothetical protein [Shimia sp. SDUM112013]|uniref:hypothetical protein n=1 Tax=Shimia sp. SDUM112013 TaxID=3136160 RepID=UPI0032EF31A2
MIRTQISVLALVLICACTPSATLISRTTGAVGKGTVENATMGNSGPLTISFKNESYSGQWVAVPNPGSYNFGLLNAYGGGTSAYGNFSSYSVSDSGFGTAILSSNKGNSMRCEFRYNTMSMTAIGVCQKQNGEVFDLQVVTS